MNPYWEQYVIGGSDYPLTGRDEDFVTDSGDVPFIATTEGESEGTFWAPAAERRS